MNRKERRKAEKQARKATKPGPTLHQSINKAAEADFDGAHRAFEIGDLARAEMLCRNLMTSHPDHAAGHNLLGIVLCRLGRGDEGVASIHAAISLAPHEPSFPANLGVALSGLGKNIEAIAAFDDALKRQPNQARTLSNLGTVLRTVGRFQDAKTAFEKAVALEPAFAEAWSNFGNVLSDLDDIPAAEQAFRTSTSLAPDNAFGHNNLGTIERRLGRYSAAVACFNRALQLSAGYGEAMNNLAEIFRETGRAHDALTLYDAALNVLPPPSPERLGIESNRLYTLNMIAAGAERTESFARSFGAQFSAPSVLKTANSDTDRPLRIGFVSSDLRRHSVSYFLEPLWAALPPERIAIYGYAASALEDDVTERLKGYASGWRSLVGLTDDQAAEAIRADALDVLVDLNGHTMGNRLGIFARKPAAVQVSWLGYPNTTGLPMMDVRLVDAVTDPVATQQWHVEKLVRLDRPFVCYQAPSDAPDVSERPTDESVVFGSFNNLAKISSETLDMWSGVLRAVPESRLFLKTKPLSDEGVTALLVQCFADRGISSDRLDLRGWILDGSHLSAYRHIDIALDSFPYHGTTTTCEALWMGVPVITRMGDVHAARVGGSLLGAVGLSELITFSHDDFIRVAASLATNPGHRAALRQSLRPAMQSSALMDGVDFTRAFEVAIRHACSAVDECGGFEVHRIF